MKKYRGGASHNEEKQDELRDLIEKGNVKNVETFLQNECNNGCYYVNIILSEKSLFINDDMKRVLREYESKTVPNGYFRYTKMNKSFLNGVGF